MVEELKVRGSSITSKFAFVKHTFGDGAEEELNERFAKSPYFPALDALWYPFSHYIEINRAIAEAHFDGDIRRLHEVGQFSAKHALTNLYKVYAKEATFVDFLKKISNLHRRFYNVGDMDPQIDESKRQVAVVLSGRREYPMEDLYVAQGFYVGAAKLLGHKDVLSKITRTNEGAVIALKWGDA